MKRTVTGDDLMRAMGGVDERFLERAYRPEEVRRAAAEAKSTPGGLFLSECRKLLGARVLWVALALFFALNSFLAYRSAGRTEEASLPTELVVRFFDGYFADPDAYEARYDEITAFEREQSELMWEAIRLGDPDVEPATLPNRYSDDDAVPDSLLFSLVHRAVDQSEGYPARLERVIDAAYANLEEFRRMGVAEDSFAWRVQTEVIRRYEAMRGTVQIGVEYVRGWGGYFDYRLGDVFVFLWLILMASVVFTQEKQAGFLPVLRSARRGRGETALVKIGLTLALSGFVTLLMIGTSWAAFGLRVGFSSPDNALQALSAFTYSPYRITVGQYFLFTIGIRLLVSAAFAMLLLVISTVFRSTVLNVLGGLALFGLNLLFTKASANSALCHLNLVSAAAVNSLFTRWRAANLFGAAVGSVPLLLVLLVLLAAGGATGAGLLHVRGGEAIRPRWLDAILSFLLTLSAQTRGAFRGERAKRRRERIRAARARRTYSLSLFWAEVFKTLVSTRFFLLLLALLAAKGWYSVRLYEPKPSYADAVYKEYMTALEGELTPEKSAWIAGERARIDGILAEKDAMQEAYRSGALDLETYRDYLGEYSWAEARSDLFTSVERHEAYLAARGSGWFLYDTGWRRLFSGDADLFLYTAVLLLLTGSFAGEFVSRSSSGGFAQILRATKRGRQATFWAKIASSGVIAVVLGLGSCAVDAAVIARAYDLPALTAPVASIEIFGAYAGGMTIGGYFALFVALRVLGALIMAMLVCALSELLSRYLPVLGSAVALTLCPAARPSTL